MNPFKNLFKSDPEPQPEPQRFPMDEFLVHWISRKADLPTLEISSPMLVHPIDVPLKVTAFATIDHNTNKEFVILFDSILDDLLRFARNKAKFIERVISRKSDFVAALRSGGEPYCAIATALLFGDSFETPELGWKELGWKGRHSPEFYGVFRLRINPADPQDD